MLSDRDMNVNAPLTHQGRQQRLPEQRNVERLLFAIVRYHTQLGINTQELEILLQIFLDSWGGQPQPTGVVQTMARSLGKTEQEVNYHLNKLHKKGLITIDVQENCTYYGFMPFLEALDRVASENHG